MSSTFSFVDARHLEYRIMKDSSGGWKARLASTRLLFRSTIFWFSIRRLGFALGEILVHPFWVRFKINSDLSIRWAAPVMSRSLQRT